MKITQIAFAASIASTSVVAWGPLGHATVALLSQNYLLPKSIEQAQLLLNDTTNTYLGNIASWADAYRYTPGGAWSAELHYVDGLDAPPPDSCVIKYPTDCPPEGCIISAIQNYTSILANRRADSALRSDALKFLVHFVGDIHQPLHTEGYAAGANGILVTFMGKKTNLHAVWDTLPNYFVPLVNGTTPQLQDSTAWANSLSARLNVGEYKRSTHKWLENIDVTGTGPAETATKWANEENKYVCDYVISDININNTDISGDYYEGAIPIVEAQIAKAGLRLASLLNNIFDGKSGFSDERGCFLAY